MKHTHKYTVITGASSGIGYEAAKAFAARGHSLILIARRTERLEKLRTEIHAAHPSIDIILKSVDLSIAENVLRVYEEVKALPLGTWVNNAGFGILKAFHNISNEENTNLINTNITALTLLSQEFIKTQKRGYILNVASIAAFLPGPLLSTYYASKAYVLSLSAAVNEELKRSGKPISVTTLCPGPMKTEFFATAGASKEFATATPRACAKRALSAMFKRKPIVFSDNLIALAAFGTKFLPINLLTKISYRIQRSKFM